MQPYQISKIDSGIYTFTTSTGCIYKCYFESYQSYFNDFPEIAPKVFGFNLDFQYQPLAPVGLDKRIADTVAIIIKSFLDDKINVAVYVCDNSDNHEKARYHKFLNWFRRFDDGEIFQIRSAFKAGDLNILSAMLIHAQNKQANDFIEAFQIVTGSYQKSDEDEFNELDNDLW